MKVLARRLARLAVATALLTPLLAGTASAAHVSCGQTVTTSITLHADVGPCAGPAALIVGANNVTIDLGGHRLFGETGPLDMGGTGVRIEGRSGVTVTNGTITDFDAAVAILDSSGTEVSNLTVRDNIQSDLGGGDFGEGIQVFGSASDNTTIVDNLIENNGPFAGISVFGGTSSNKITGTTISGNTVKDNNVGSQTGGIRLENWTWDSTVSNNTITGNALEGVALFADTEANDLLTNTISGNGFTSLLATHRRGDGIRAFVRSNNNDVRSNTVTGNAGYGIIIQGQSNQLVGNTATGNDQAADPPPSSARHTDLKDTNATCDNNSWRGNTFGTADPTCTTGGFQADVSVTNADSPDPVTAGSNITYTIAVANAGPDGASTVALSDALSENTQFMSVSTTQGSCSHSGENKGGTVTCALGSVASGSSANVSVVAKAKAAGVSTSNTATASSATADPNSANNSATATTTVN